MLNVIAAADAAAKNSRRSNPSDWLGVFGFMIGTPYMEDSFHSLSDRVNETTYIHRLPYVLPGCKVRHLGSG
jgi:hypothetical protein